MGECSLKNVPGGRTQSGGLVNSALSGKLLSVIRHNHTERQADRKAARQVATSHWNAL